MDGSTIATLALFGPGAGALPAIAALWRRSQQHAAAERAVFHQLPAGPGPSTRSTPVPPTPGIPAATYTVPLAHPTTTPPAATPAPAEADVVLAPVIDLPTRRRVA